MEFYETFSGLNNRENVKRIWGHTSIVQSFWPLDIFTFEKIWDFKEIRRFFSLVSGNYWTLSWGKSSLKNKYDNEENKLFLSVMFDSLLNTNITAFTNDILSWSHLVLMLTFPLWGWLQRPSDWTTWRLTVYVVGRKNL